MSHRSTIYPCCLPTLGEFDRSWSHRTYPGTKVQKNILLTNIWNTFYQKIFPIIIKQLYTSKLKVSLFFLSIPISGFIPSDRFARNGPVRLSLISSVLLLLGKTKSFVFLSLIRRTHWPAELLTVQKNFTLRFRQTPPIGRSENLTGHSFPLQWSSGIKPCISH